MSGPARPTALIALQVLVTALPLALLPFLGLTVARMSPSPALWTALALAAPAVTTLALTPVWTRLAQRFSLGSLLLWTGAVSGLSCAMIALAGHPTVLVLARLLQGAAGGGVVLALAFRATGATAGAGFTRMQQASAAGCLVGPVLGGLAFESERFGALMLLGGGLTVLAALLAAPGLRAVPPEPTAESGAGRIRGGPLLFAGMCGSAGAFAFVAFFPTWATAHDPTLYTPGLIGGLHSLSWLAALLILPVWGRGIDAAAPVPVLALALVGTGLAFAAIPLDLGLCGIVVLRLAQGGLYAGQAPALFAAMDAAGPGRVAGIAQARASLTVGQLVGPLAAGLMLAPFGPGGALWAAACLSLAGAVGLLAARTRPIPSPWSRAR
ncbi:MFS transporter [Methylobacterium sp. J-078]|uniref:MFS transporter n=1 Tax=Methylobacterium sp. J-078 TaxID=2836657 RepID=UPI001FBB9DB8|nr:MFS transporter [Methylobacterium sp. J-078]MCJ2043046.1 MFS transporter [Methylobacterium sp. J-078]